MTQQLVPARFNIVEILLLAGQCIGVWWHLFPLCAADLAEG
jgi:hypothetical protein